MSMRAAVVLPVADVESKVFKHIPFLDGMRALAIFFVLTFHTNGPMAKAIARNGGWVGVDAFFVISGFLITGILLKEQQRTGTLSLKNFYIRRALRLVPAYLLFIIVISLLNPLHCHYIWAAAGTAALYMSDIDLAMCWGHILGSGLEITWSLSVEEKFYLFWPTIMKTAKRHLPVIAILSIIGCFIWRAYLICHDSGWGRLCCAFDTKLDAMMIGCLAAIAMHNMRVRNFLERYLKHGWMSVALVVALFYYVRGIGHPSGAVTLISQLLYWEVRVPAFVLLFTVLILCLSVQPRSLTTKLFSTAPLVWLGRISYSLYLWHMLAFSTVTIICKKSVNANPFVELACLALAVAFAACSYYFVEKPFLNIKERLARQNELVIVNDLQPEQKENRPLVGQSSL